MIRNERTVEVKKKKGKKRIIKKRGEKIPRESRWQWRQAIGLADGITIFEFSADVLTATRRAWNVPRPAAISRD